MLKRLRRLITWYVVLAIAGSAPAWAQFGLSKHKEADKPVQASDKPPELSDNDKKKLAEIEQRPEVRDEIESAWQDQRASDLEFAYEVNNSLRLGDVGALQYAEFLQKYGRLYDNPMLQRYINNLGQGLVPKDSPNIYSFKLLLDPMPRAEVLSTGTVFISTGLVSMADNEAQVAYVLAHEIAHVERKHMYGMIKNAVLERELNQEREKSAERKRTIFSGVTAGLGAALGGAFGGGRGAVLGGLVGGFGGYGASMLLIRSKSTATEWSTVSENEADEAAFQYVLDSHYDVREIPRLYARLENEVGKDTRLALGFVGKPARIKERIASAQGLLSGSHKAEIDSLAKAGKLKLSDAEFPVLMAALKCDNGIVALDYDLFAMSRDNLEEAVALRSRDARAESYLGKVIALTGRTQEDQQQAVEHFAKAIQYDAERGAYPEPHLQHALFLIGRNNPADAEEIRKELQTYVALYQREHRGGLPENMAILYDYFALEGDRSWYVAPTSEVSTRYAEPLNVSNVGNGSVPGARQVVEKATEGHSGQGNTVPVRKKSVSGPAPQQ
jgi:Peptidase family M48